MYMHIYIDIHGCISICINKDINIYIYIPTCLVIHTPIPRPTYYFLCIHINACAYMQMYAHMNLHP